tara:strand:- start:603 stop:908 length:306 start_codon:yes stop_codon:yes gene_type:complete
MINVIYKSCHYQGKRKLNKPFRTPSASKKFGVYVRNKRTGRVQIVRFGAKGMSIKKNIPARQKSFFARFRPILAKVRRSGKQVTLSSAYWAIQSWKKGFKI